MALTLLDVNNNCLLEIFKKLSVSELADVASTCTRLKTVARDAFSRYHKSNRLKIDVQEIEYRRHQAAILRNFGDMITRMLVNFWVKDEEGNTFLFNLLAKYCTGDVERLVLMNCKTLQPDKIVDETTLFRKVKELKLYRSPAINASFLSEAKQLTSFELPGLHARDRHPNKLHFLSNDYPKLQSLSLEVAHSPMDQNQSESDIGHFIRRHPNLVELELHGGKYHFSLIGERHSLRRLSVQFCKCDYMPIAQLENLTTLKLSKGQSLIKMLQTSLSSHSLEELNACFAPIGFLAAISRFSNMNRLAFSAESVLADHHLSDIRRLQKLRVLSIEVFRIAITSDGLIDLVRHLPDLEQLCLSVYLPGHSIELKESTYLQLCKIYRDRNKKLVISNFDMLCDDLRGLHAVKEPFAGDDQRNFVQYITFGDKAVAEI